MTGDTVTRQWVSTLPFSVPFEDEELEAVLTTFSIEGIREDDEVLGSLTDNEKIALALMGRFFEATEGARLDHTYARSDEDRAAAELLSLKNGAKADTMRSIFWTMVRDGHNLWSRGDIGIRGDFQIVNLKESGLMGILRRATDRSR